MLPYAITHPVKTGRPLLKQLTILQLTVDNQYLPNDCDNLAISYLKFQWTAILRIGYKETNIGIK